MSDVSNQEIDFRKTLNLPQTDFPMRAGLAKKEPVYLEKWNTEDLYAQIRKQSEGKKSFLLHDGPPYANGNIHIGHALNKILKDIIVKYKTSQGFDSLYVPGWDCHGLPIEHQLLKELKKKKNDVDCVEFRKSAHDYALKYVDIQKDQFKRLGIFGQWDEPYLTLNSEYEYWILNSLARLNDDGYVYRGLKPVNWCFNCETALAEAEVEYADHVSQSVYVKFAVKNADVIDQLANKKVSLLIWTTTPWTLIANVAVAVHGAFSYCAVEVGDEILIMEQSLSQSILAKAGITDFKIVKELKGDDLTQLVYEHPFGLRDESRVVIADYVTKEDGTGLVHTAPGHGQDDFETGKKNNLDVIMPVNDRGVYTKEAGPYEGQHILKANVQIIEDLKEKGVLFVHEPLNHSYPHCWRCKKPIIFRATKQWFLSIDHNNLRGKVKDIIKRDVKWIPETGEERILKMVTGRPDWCLSRQRYWGVPIPALKCKGDEEHRLYSEVIDHFAKIVKNKGTNAWFELDVKELIPEGFKCPVTGSEEFEKTYDILDVWFDSGVSHQAVVKSRLGLELPIDLYLEGSDQHRGWFQSSLIPAVAMEGKAPFKEVLTHGFVVDGQGRKMSKSVGNVISPLDIIKNNGADILRLWVASSAYNEDIRISKEALDRLVDAYRKIRNTLRYLLGNLFDFNPTHDILAYDQLLDLDKWALNRLSNVMKDVEANYDQYDFSKVYKNVYAFCNEDLSNFYLDILKDRLYISAANSLERKSAQSALYHIIQHVLRALAPILIFTSEEVLSYMPKSEEQKDISSVHLLKWVKLPEQWHNPDVEKRFKQLLLWRPFVMKALEDERREGLIGSPLEAKVVFETASERDFKYLTELKEILSEFFVVSQVEVQQSSSILKPIGADYPKTSITIKKADGQKCSRSWKYSADVGEDPDYPTLSLRSARIVKEIKNAS